mmetsp:Transcript_66909/g.156866  ORF Transcript_66909/g.156866 Transcript_66909/m.156866 type:complete len:248 (+) Transcript_66909:883-1626(+)
MENQHLAVHQVGERKIPEGLREEVEEVHIILGAAFAAEAVQDVRLQHLMVSPVQEDGLRILQLQSEDRHDHLDGPGASIHEVAVEDEGSIRGGLARHAQQVQKVPVLAVKVADHGQLTAGGNGGLAQCPFRSEDVDDVQQDQVRILLRQELAVLLHGQQSINEAVGDAAWASVPRPVVARRIRHCLCTLAFAGKLRGGPARKTRLPFTTLGTMHLRRPRWPRRPRCASASAKCCRKPDGQSSMGRST